MSIFITADLHLGHEAIRRHCNRPWPTLEEMDEALISNWNATVPKRKALIYIVGDFAWKNHNRYLNRLNGKKVLIKGNHDKMSQDCLKNFSGVYERLATKIDDKVVVFDHYCGLVWNRSVHGSWLIYGHSHGRIGESETIPRCDAGVDVWGYRPVPWEAMKKKLESRIRPPFGEDSAAEAEMNVEENRRQNMAVWP